MTEIGLKSQLDELLPFGMLATKQWLLAKGVGRHRIDNALKSRKLERLATGVYARVGVPVTWQGVVSSLQKMVEDPVHVGGLSALALLGFGHYLPSPKTVTIHLYSQAKRPLWLERLDLPVAFIWHSAKALWSPEFITMKDYGVEHDWREDLPPVTLSCPEKACLEMLMGVPTNISFDHANQLMQGMTSLSPRKLAFLLNHCRNVKVKRLFFWLAQRQHYLWLKKLDYHDFDLGSGNRVIATGGKLDKTYLITVPAHMYGSQ
ncbi:MAG: hypothetical protein COC14_00010 [Burkholderiaceae bacterium]|nr:MAG: hypothetical protein COC14_00010 [Burkholderiaceae bacterium]